MQKDRQFNWELGDMLLTAQSHVDLMRTDYLKVQEQLADEHEAESTNIIKCNYRPEES